MTNALLISSDPYVISEFRQIAQITGALVDVVSEPEKDKIAHASHIFVDAQMQADFNSHCTIWIVTSGPAGPQAWQAATQHRADHIASLPGDRASITQALTIKRTRRAETTSFVSLGNGIGTSTVACHVAAALSRMHDGVVLVDMDLRDGGLDISLGHENEQGCSWFEAHNTLRTSRSEFSSRLPRWNDLAYLAVPIGAQAPDEFRSFDVLDAVLNDFRHVVIDVDPHDEAGELIERSDNVCFVVTNSLRGIAVAQSRLKKFDTLPDAVGLVVREIPGCPVAPLMVAQTMGLPLWGSVPTDPRVVETTEQGLGPIPIRSGSFNRSIGSIVNQLMRSEVQSRVA